MTNSGFAAPWGDGEKAQFRNNIACLTTKEKIIDTALFKASSYLSVTNCIKETSKVKTVSCLQFAQSASVTSCIFFILGCLSV